MLPVLNLLAAYPEHADTNAVEYLGSFEPAFLKDGLEDSEEDVAIRAVYESLVVCNVPASVEALDMAHNHAHVLGMEKIIVVIFSSDCGTDYGDYSAMWWEDFVGGRAGEESNLTAALSHEEATNYSYRDFIADADDAEEYTETTFAKCAQGAGLLAKLLEIYQREHGLERKELSFVTFRDRRPKKSLDPRKRRTIVGPNLETWTGPNKDNDISLRLIRGLAVLQKPGIPIRIATQGNEEVRDQLRRIAEQETDLAIEIIDANL